MNEISTNVSRPSCDHDRLRKWIRDDRTHLLPACEGCSTCVSVKVLNFATGTEEMRSMYSLHYDLNRPQCVCRCGPWWRLWFRDTVMCVCVFASDLRNWPHYYIIQYNNLGTWNHHNTPSQSPENNTIPQTIKLSELTILRNHTQPHSQHNTQHRVIISRLPAHNLRQRALPTKVARINVSKNVEPCEGQSIDCQLSSLFISFMCHVTSRSKEISRYLFTIGSIDYWYQVTNT